MAKNKKGSTGKKADIPASNDINNKVKYNQEYYARKRKQGSLGVQSKGFNPALIPLIIVIAVIPFIVYRYVYHTGMSSYDFYPANDEAADYFLYYKAFCFIMISAVMGVILIVKLIIGKREIRFHKIFIPVGVYALLALLSAIFSDYGSFSFSGSFEQFESVWVLLGYCLVSYYAFLFIQDERDVKFLINILFVGTVIMLLLGLSQAFSHDFYRSDIGQRMITPAGYIEQMGPLKFNFAPNVVYLSMYNPNYVGSYVSLLSPVFLVLLLSTKRIYMRIIYAVMYVGLLLVLLGSGSRAGFAGVIVALLIFSVIFNKIIIRNILPALCVISLIITSFLTMNNLNNGSIVNRIKNAFAPSEITPALERLETNDDNLTVTYKGEQLVVRFYADDFGYSFGLTDGNGAEVSQRLTENGAIFNVEDERFTGFKLQAISFNDSLGFSLTIDGHEWYFTNQYDDTYYYINSYAKFMKLPDSESFEPLLRYGRIASGRGFIWAKTIPLLKDNILLGTGPDTFIFEFPNTDAVGMYNYGYHSQLMTKPHNMYLQIGVQTGVISLLAVLAFYAWYFFWSISLYVREQKRDYLSLLGTGILAGTFGYMVVGMINDSTITVAPLYWVLMGIGIAVNVMVGNKRLEENMELIKK